MISVGSVCMVERRPTNNNLFILNKNKLIFAYAYLNDEHFLANKPGRHSTFQLCTYRLEQQNRVVKFKPSKHKHTILKVEELFKEQNIQFVSIQKYVLKRSDYLVLRDVEQISDLSYHKSSNSCIFRKIMILFSIYNNICLCGNVININKEYPITRS